MPSKYWIKLYHEILDDPKMARLSDRLYRRTIELFLLAGKSGDDGGLPCLPDIAWHLRIDTGELLRDLRELATVGIVSPIDDTQESEWIVPKFAVRQAATSDAKRMAQWRERKQQAQYEGDASVTELVTNRNVEPEKNQNRIRVDADASSAQNAANPAAAISESLTSYVYTTIDEGMGWNLSPNSLEEIGALIDEYPKREWWDYALRECVISQTRNLRYLNKCLATAQKRAQPIKPIMIREKRAPPPIEWGQVLETLYSMQTRASVDMWLGSATVEVIDKTLIVAPSTRNARDWITNRMATSITAAVGQLGDDWHWKLKEADDGTGE